MNIKVSKEKLDRHFEYDWFKYVIILIAAIGLWVLLYTTVNNFKDFETVHIYALIDGGYNNNSKEYFQSEVLTDLKNSGDTVVLQATFEITAANSQGAAEVAATRMITADILIFNAGYTESNYAGYVELTEEIIAEYGWSGFKFLEKDGKKYAVEITPGEDYFTKLSDIFYLNKPEEGAEAERYYLGLNKSSTNVGAYSSAKKASASNAQAFRAADLFLTKYK